MLPVQVLIKKTLVYKSTVPIDEDEVKSAIHDFFRRATTRFKISQKSG